MNSNEWGLPDWRDETSYGRTDTWSTNRWRWEFLRRNVQYRADFLKWEKPTRRAIQKNIEAPLDPNRKLKLRNEELYRTKKATPEHIDTRMTMIGGAAVPWPSITEKYETRTLPDPRISKQPFFVLMMLFRIQLFFTKNDDVLGDIPAQSFIRDNDVMLTFSLDKALQPQLDHAKKRLKYEQKCFLEKEAATKLDAAKKKPHPATTKRQKDLWILYLQALDGKEAGETFHALEINLFLGLKKTPQSGRDTWEAACKLRDNPALVF